VPTTFLGLAIFVAFLVPGFIQSVQRQRRVPQRKLSPLAESTAIATVSLITGSIALGLFALIRSCWPAHTPDIRLLFQQGGDYAYPRLGYLGGWAFAVLAVSCALAFIVGLQPRPLRWVNSRFTPIIVQTSLSYQVLDADAPKDALVYVGCDLRDGSYVGGYLDWYSVEPEEIGDRDLVLAEPITVKTSKTTDPDGEQLDVARVVISARDIVRMLVSYIEDGDGAEDETDGAPDAVSEPEPKPSGARSGRGQPLPASRQTKAVRPTRHASEQTRSRGLLAA
jgi:hypothetical protein